MSLQIRYRVLQVFRAPKPPKSQLVRYASPRTPQLPERVVKHHWTSQHILPCSTRLLHIYLFDRLHHYDDDVDSKERTETEGTVEVTNVQQPDPISPLSVLSAFQMPETPTVSTGTQRCGFYKFLWTNMAVPDFNARTCQTCSSWSRQVGKLVPNCQAVNLLLMTYATENIIPEADVKLVKIRPLGNQNTMQYVQALWMEALRCRTAYDVYRLHKTFYRAFATIHSRKCP